MGNVITKLDAEGRCSFTTYDHLNRATAVRYFASTNAATNTQATCAAVTTSTTTVEETHSYTFDSITATLGGPGGKGRVSRISDASGRVDYVYDLNGRIASKANVLTGATNTTKTVTYAYNAAGQMTAMTTPSGQTITYTYGAPSSNAPGKVIGIKLGTTTLIDVIKGSVYAPFGPNGGWSWGNHGSPNSPINQHLRVFDKDYRPTAIASDPEGYNRNLTWDQANRITAITVPGTTSGVPTITIPGITNAMSVNQSYGYDALDRLTNFAAGYPGATTSATGQGVLPAEAFTFDAIGNRLSSTATPPGGSAATATYAYPNLATTSGSKRHSLASISGARSNTYTYDATGNTKSESAALGTAFNALGAPLTHTYDAKNRLSTVQIGSNSADVVSYKINAMGQRVQKIGAGSFAYSVDDTLDIYSFMSPRGLSLQFNARYLYDEQGRLLGEYSPEGKLIAETIWFDDLPVATLRPLGSSIQLPLGIAGTGAAAANNAGNNTPANPVNVEIFYLHPDHLGTPRVATRSTQALANIPNTSPVDASLKRANKAVWRWESDAFGQAKPDAPNLLRGGVDKFGNVIVVRPAPGSAEAANITLNLRFPGQLADSESGKFYKDRKSVV